MDLEQLDPEDPGICTKTSVVNHRISSAERSQASATMSNVPMVTPTNRSSRISVRAAFVVGANPSDWNARWQPPVATTL